MFEFRLQFPDAGLGCASLGFGVYAGFVRVVSGREVREFFVLPDFSCLLGQLAGHGVLAWRMSTVEVFRYYMASGPGQDTGPACRTSWPSGCLCVLDSLVSILSDLRGLLLFLYYTVAVSIPGRRYYRFREPPSACAALRPGALAFAASSQES